MSYAAATWLLRSHRQAKDGLLLAAE